MRTLSADGLKGILSHTTDQVYLFAIKISHEDLAEPYYVVQNNIDLTISLPDEGNVVFSAYAFDFILPKVEEDSLPMAQIKIDNINDFLIPWLRTINTAPIFDIFLVRTSPLETTATIELEFNFSLKAVKWDIMTIDGELSLDYDYLNEPCMKYRFTPEISVGLFDYSYEGAGSFIRETTIDGDPIRRPLPVAGSIKLP
jgi:hypothetical protein